MAADMLPWEHRLLVDYMLDMPTDTAVDKPVGVVLRMCQYEVVVGAAGLVPAAVA
jgi:hypothetical protein